MALCAARMGIRQLFVPAQENARRPPWPRDHRLSVENIAQLVAHLTGDTPSGPRPPGPPSPVSQALPDFAGVMGRKT